MRPPHITIRRYPYEEPYHLNLVISASNGSFAGTLEYYCNADDLGRMGSRLMAFPEGVGDTYSYELGSPRPEDRCAFHLAFRARTLDSSGHCALEFELNNNRQHTDRCSCSFAIRTETAAINRLGRLLMTFGELKHSTLLWSETDGRLLVDEHTLGAERDGPASER